MGKLNKSFNKLFLYCIILALLPFAFSCTNTKNAVYFNNLRDSAIVNAMNTPDIIQKNDIIAITISSNDAEASKIFNPPSANSGSSQSGYLVDADGNIQLPILGNVKAAGLTKSQLKVNITKTFMDKKLLVDPIVTIQHLNYKITVLGEVSNPSVINVPNEKITILEAIGFAGDMTMFAKRDNVLLIREENGRKIFKRLNLNTDEIFRSEYYYLKSNDILYIEPNKAKVAGTNRSQSALPLVMSSLSFAIGIATIFIK